MAIEITELSAGYGRKLVLKNISGRIEKGRVCALLGHNGSGKTTLMNCINGLIMPSKGQIRIVGKDISRMSRVQIAQLISLVPQSCYSAFAFSVIDMILMGGAARVNAWSSPGLQERNKALEVMEEVGILHLEKEQYADLSGGQQQMVLLARALYQDTPLMLLDEPNSHLDFCNQHRMMELMREIVGQRGVTALITLHDPNLALYYCDDIIMLREGHIVAQGLTSNIMNDVNLRQALGENIQITGTTQGMKVVVPYLSNCRIPVELMLHEKEAAKDAV